MEYINFAYSLKNIEIPTHSTYKFILTEKIEGLIKKMRWKAHFFLKVININTIDNFKLKSKKCPLICKDMQASENDITDMVKDIKFTKHQDNFRKKIINNTKKNTQLKKKGFIFTDETTNLYSTSFTNYKNLTTNNVTQIYKKAPEITMNNMKSKK